jgi:hypothetical protein
LPDADPDGPNDPDDLSECELQVVRAAETGKLVDLAAGDPALDLPDLGGQWPKERTVRATVLSQLLTGAGRLGRAQSRAVRIQGGRISGQLEVEGATLRCPLFLSGCYFDESIRLAEASAPTIRLSGSRVPGIFARQLATRGDLELTSCIVVGASVDVTGAHIGGQFNCDGGKLSNPAGVALNADGIKVDQGLFLRDGFEAEGEVRLIGAHVGGRCSCSGSKLRNPGANALSADSLKVGQGLFLRDGFEAEGEVRLLGANVSGQLSCIGAKLRNPGGVALNADSLQVDQGLLLSEGFEAEGEVRLLGAHMGGVLSCIGGKLSNSGGIALYGDRLQVNQSLFIGEGFEAEGEVRLIGAHVGGQISCDGGKLSNPGGVALDLERANVEGPLYLDPAVFEGRLDLTLTRVGLYEDAALSWPAVISLDGFTYGTIARTVSVKLRLQWLDRNKSGYSPQIYDQLASSYRRAGHEQDARLVAVTKQRRRRARLNIAGKLWGLLLDGTIGYGYRTWQAGVWLLGLVGLGTVIFSRWSSQLTAVKRPPEQPEFSAFLYTLDQLLPVLNLHQRDAWLPHGPIAYVALAFTVAGWVLTSAVVLSLTGLLKRTDAG